MSTRLSTLCFLVACGETAAPQPATPAAPPSPATLAAAPHVPLLTAPKGADGQCQLTRTDGTSATALGAIRCGTAELVFDTAGKRVWASGVVLDLASGTTTKPAALPTRTNPLGDTHHFFADGRPAVIQTWGSGDEVWAEGPSYTIHHSEALVLEGTAWKPVAQLVTEAGVPRDGTDRSTWLTATKTAERVVHSGGTDPGTEWVEDTLLQGGLAKASGHGDDVTWMAGGAPMVAYAMEESGEGECAVGPVLRQQGEVWTPLFAEDWRSCLGVARKGGWLLVSTWETWVLLNVETGTEAARGTGFVAFAE